MRGDHHLRAVGRRHEREGDPTELESYQYQLRRWSGVCVCVSYVMLYILYTHTLALSDRNIGHTHTSGR